MNGAPGNSSELAGLYRDAIRQHAAHPVGYRQNIQATHRHEEYNPLCGDRVEIALRIRDDTIEAAAFDGEACTICMASASLLCALAPGHPTGTLQRLHDELLRALRSDAAVSPAGEQEHGGRLPDALRPLLGVRPYPSRIKCATLPWSAARLALGAGKHPA
jgi:nitrogen fixation NifU-like protein